MPSNDSRNKGQSVKLKKQNPQKNGEKVIVKIRGWGEKEWWVSKSKKLFVRENEESHY